MRWTQQLSLSVGLEKPTDELDCLWGNIHVHQLIGGMDVNKTKAQPEGLYRMSHVSHWDALHIDLGLSRAWWY